MVTDVTSWVFVLIFRDEFGDAPQTFICESEDDARYWFKHMICDPCAEVVERPRPARQEEFINSL